MSPDNARERVAGTTMGGAQLILEALEQDPDAPVDIRSALGSLPVAESVTALDEIAGVNELPESDIDLVEAARDAAREAAIAAVPADVSLERLREIASDPSEALDFTRDVYTAALNAYSARFKEEIAP